MLAFWVRLRNRHEACAKKLKLKAEEFVHVEITCCRPVCHCVFSRHRDWPRCRWPSPTPKAATPKSKPPTPNITEQEVNAAQQAWCDALVKIGKMYAANGDYKAVAKQAITDLYDYDNGKVFFKPTLAHGKNTFRPDQSRRTVRTSSAATPIFPKTKASP